MSFRKPQAITRIGAGEYVNGVFVPGVESTIVILASVQPVTAQDIATPPEGKRLSDYVKIYTSSELQVLNEVAGLEPDQLVWRGHTYECTSGDQWQNGVISHRKYLFSKLSQQ